MKLLIVCAAILAIASCKPFDEAYVHVHQDTKGNYKATFNTGDFKKTEEGFEGGQVKGFYSYVDGDGKLQKVDYTAGEQGFVATGTNFPVPQPENAEVVKAREEHLAAYKEVLKYLPITDEFYQTGEEPSTSFLKTKMPVSSHSGLVPVVKYVEYELPIHQ